MLFFLAFNGHLIVIGLLVKSFEMMPIASFAAGSFDAIAIARYGQQVFMVGLLFALPIVAALLAANLALGVLTRAAPQLNLFAVGFPATIFGGIVLLMLLYASALGIKILLKWDYHSSSEQQLTLERKTYLISTLINYAFGFVVFSGFLYIFTVDEIHKLFVGAMCATGSLNANPVGWHVLWTKMLSFFFACNRTKYIGLAY